jgi:hypothetical protein
LGARKLKEIVIYKSVEQIAHGAFKNTGVEIVTLPFLGVNKEYIKPPIYQRYFGAIFGSTSRTQIVPVNETPIIEEVAGATMQYTATSNTTITDSNTGEVIDAIKYTFYWYYIPETL